MFRRQTRTIEDREKWLLRNGQEDARMCAKVLIKAKDRLKTDTITTALHKLEIVSKSLS